MSFTASSIRAFVPAKDFSLSKEFYLKLGFTIASEWQGGALFTAGPQSFILQDFYKKDFAENFMMQLMVPDLDAWWAHADSLRLAEKYNVRAPIQPEMQPWGIRMATLFDPSQVLWHIAQG